MTRNQIIDSFNKIKDLDSNISSDVLDFIEIALTSVIDSDLIDKQTAVNFCQHLLKDFSTQEVTLSDLNDFLNIK